MLHPLLGEGVRGVEIESYPSAGRGPTTATRTACSSRRSAATSTFFGQPDGGAGALSNHCRIWSSCCLRRAALAAGRSARAPVEQHDVAVFQVVDPATRGLLLVGRVDVGRDGSAWRVVVVVARRRRAEAVLDRCAQRHVVVRPRMSVAKPSRGVGSGAGLAGALGEAAGEADGAADAGRQPPATLMLPATQMPHGDPGACDGEPGGRRAAGAGGSRRPVRPRDGAGVGVGVARIDGLGVRDSTGPGVSSEVADVGLAGRALEKHERQDQHADEGGAADDQAAVALERALLANSATGAPVVGSCSGRLARGRRRRWSGGRRSWSDGGGFTAHGTARSFGHWSGVSNAGRRRGRE